ncbi:tyrosine-type recombinase/integrase, partial [Mycoplasmopsis bovis]|uniref:tyrosine-type recombinase/integrase n=1 Tax=Mycoplasmopsis bovis TaxID=28903 RepID=UPI003D2D44C5
YLESRNDKNQALFVTLRSPLKRVSINAIESRLRKIGKIFNIQKLHPHKFRRTLATMAIDKGMPIEQVQKLLGHEKVDTTLKYAMVFNITYKMAFNVSNFMKNAF